MDLPAPRSGFYIANSFTSARHEASSRVLRSGTTVFDLSTKRELNNGFGNALTTAVELAVTPALFAFLGWRLDLWLGTSPLFLARSSSSFTLGYVAWREYTRYQAHDGASRSTSSSAPKRRRSAS